MLGKVSCTSMGAGFDSRQHRRGGWGDVLGSRYMCAEFITIREQVIIK